MLIVIGGQIEHCDSVWFTNTALMKKNYGSTKSGFVLIVKNSIMSRRRMHSNNIIIDVLSVNQGFSVYLTSTANNRRSGAWRFNDLLLGKSSGLYETLEIPGWLFRNFM